MAGMGRATHQGMLFQHSITYQDCWACIWKSMKYVLKRVRISIKESRAVCFRRCYIVNPCHIYPEYLRHTQLLNCFKVWNEILGESFWGSYSIGLCTASRENERPFAGMLCQLAYVVYYSLLQWFMYVLMCLEDDTMYIYYMRYILWAIM